MSASEQVDSPIAAGTSVEDELLAKAREFILLARLDKATFSGPVFDHGEGSVLVDVNGKEHLDFNSGQMCSALGHRHPRVVAAIKDACDRLIHSSSVFFNVPEVRLAERLGSILPRPLKRSLFLESGSDSNEVAVSVAKKTTGRYEVASPHISFHGLTDAARATTFAGWHHGYGPYSPGSSALMAPYCYRCPIARKFPDCGLACLEGSFEVLDAQTDVGLAAVITEPLFSAGGVIEPPPGWLARLKEKCRERGALLIFDEAQTGLGKLGTMWGHEEAGVVPDVLTISKHFGGGVSVSAVCTTDEIAEQVLAVGLVHGHSHMSDPLACAAAHASLDAIIDDGLPAKAGVLGAYWRERLEELATQHEEIGDIRGRGLLQGIELVHDRETKEPALEFGNRVEAECVRRGLLMSVRRQGSVLRFVPPWTTTEAQFDRGAEILGEAMNEIRDQMARERQLV